MLDTISGAVLAALVFVGGHFLLSSEPLRSRLIARLGENGFRGVYSVVAVIGLIWLVIASGRTPHVEIWTEPPGARTIALVAMLFASIFFVLGSMRYDTSVGGHDDVAGVTAITRHPVLWGICLFGLAHLLVRGDLGSILLFGGLVVLSLGGMVHIDARKRKTGGEAWHRFEAATSATPFGAIIAGRVPFRPLALLDWRLASAVALYVVLIALHEWVIGLPPYPT